MIWRLRSFSLNPARRQLLQTFKPDVAVILIFNRDALRAQFMVPAHFGHERTICETPDATNIVIWGNL
jgi:hypothetical protein